MKSKRLSAAPAKDLYTSALFARRRRHAEQSGAPWFVVSSRWGVVEPDEVIAPYDLYLGDMPVSFRRAWAELVTAQLALRLPLAGAHIEVHAGDHYVDALRPALERAGAIVSDPVTAASMGETLAWYDNPTVVADSVVVRPPTGDDLVLALNDVDRAVSPTELRLLPATELAGPGLYSWWVDADGAADLTRGLGHGLSAGLVYAGQAGATHHRSGKPSGNTLGGRLLGMHLGGRARMSTFRLSLGSILWPLMDGSADEAALTAWMHAHLRVVPVAVHDADTLDSVETDVLTHLDPPLNLAKMPYTPLRGELSRLRRRYATPQ